MSNDWVRLAILMSILLLIAFPFAGFAPLTLLFFIAVAGWGVRILNTIISATEASESD